MASFEYPPLTPDPDPAPLSPSIPLNPPMVGEASPFLHADGENRDLILESIRAWIRTSLLKWTSAWQAYLVYWLALVADWLNEFVTEADQYITDHAVAGYSTRLTATSLNATGTTTVTLTGVDVDHRPVVVGDLVIDESPDNRFGIVTSVVDTTHAVVEVQGNLKGLTGHGWWVTATTISATGTTDVVLATEADRVPQINDLVSDESSALRYGIVTDVIDATHVTVSPLGVLRGLAGFGWWTTATPITHSGTTAVVLATGPDRLPQINDLVVDNTDDAAWGEITVVTDATHVTVAYVGTLGSGGGGGAIASIVPGVNVTVDATDPANPIVKAGADGASFILPLVSSFPAAPSGGHFALVGYDGVGAFQYRGAILGWQRLGTVQSVVQGTGITVDSSSYEAPVVSVNFATVLARIIGSRNVQLDTTTTPGSVIVEVAKAANKFWLPEFATIPSFDGAADQVALFNYNPGSTGRIFEYNGIGILRIGHMDGIQPGWGLLFVNDGTNGWDYNEPFVRYVMPDQTATLVVNDTRHVGDFRWNTATPGPEIWDGTSWRAITIV